MISKRLCCGQRLRVARGQDGRGKERTRCCLEPTTTKGCRHRQSLASTSRRHHWWARPQCYWHLPLEAPSQHTTPAERQVVDPPTGYLIGLTTPLMTVPRHHDGEGVQPGCCRRCRRHCQRLVRQETTKEPHCCEMVQGKTAQRVRHQTVSDGAPHWVTHHRPAHTTPHKNTHDRSWVKHARHTHIQARAGRTFFLTKRRSFARMPPHILLRPLPLRPLLLGAEPLLATLTAGLATGDARGGLDRCTDDRGVGRGFLTLAPAAPASSSSLSDDGGRNPDLSRMVGENCASCSWRRAFTAASADNVGSPPPEDSPPGPCTLPLRPRVPRPRMGLTTRLRWRLLRRTPRLRLDAERRSLEPRGGARPPGVGDVPRPRAPALPNITSSSKPRYLVCGGNDGVGDGQQDEGKCAHRSVCVCVEGHTVRSRRVRPSVHPQTVAPASSVERAADAWTLPASWCSQPATARVPAPSASP